LSHYIQELIPGNPESNDTFEWPRFVRLCRQNITTYPHVCRRDGFKGSICNNAEKVLHCNERPQMKNFNGRRPIQICVKSTIMAGKLESSIRGVYVIRASWSRLFSLFCLFVFFSYLILISLLKVSNKYILLIDHWFDLMKICLVWLSTKTDWYSIWMNLWKIVVKKQEQIQSNLSNVNTIGTDQKCSLREVWL